MWIVQFRVFPSLWTPRIHWVQMLSDVLFVDVCVFIFSDFYYLFIFKILKSHLLASWLSWLWRLTLLFWLGGLCGAFISAVADIKKVIDKNSPKQISSAIENMLKTGRLATQSGLDLQQVSVKLCSFSLFYHYPHFLIFGLHFQLSFFSGWISAAIMLRNALWTQAKFQNNISENLFYSLSCMHYNSNRYVWFVFLVVCYSLSSSIGVLVH